MSLEPLLSSSGHVQCQVSLEPLWPCSVSSAPGFLIVLSGRVQYLVLPEPLLLYQAVFGTSTLPFFYHKATQLPLPSASTVHLVYFSSSKTCTNNLPCPPCYLKYFVSTQFVVYNFGCVISMLWNLIQLLLRALSLFGNLCAGLFY